MHLAFSLGPDWIYNYQNEALLVLLVIEDTAFI